MGWLSDLRRKTVWTVSIIWNIDRWCLNPRRLLAQVDSKSSHCFYRRAQSLATSLYIEKGLMNLKVILALRARPFGSLLTAQDAKIRKIIGFPFGKPPIKIGFPLLSLAFRKHSESLVQGLAFQGFHFYRVSVRKSLSEKWLFDTVFGYPGKPESQ